MDDKLREVTECQRCGTPNRGQLRALEGGPKGGRSLMFGPLFCPRCRQELNRAFRRRLTPDRV